MSAASRSHDLMGEKSQRLKDQGCFFFIAMTSEGKLNSSIRMYLAYSGTVYSLLS